MFNNNGCCGGCSEEEEVTLSKEDRKALLIEKQAILEAKLATLKHWIESVDKEEETKKK